MQVDQRDWVNPGQILDRPAASWAKLPDGSPYEILVYTNPATASPGYAWWPTYTGVASHTTLGSEDEVSFLADDSGPRPSPSTPLPPGVDAASLEQVHVTDPLVSTQDGYVYLFSSPTLTGGGAGTTGVSYDFSLDSGNYESTYHMGTASLAPNSAVGPNPEHSSVTTPKYTLAMGDRWLNDGLTMGGGPNLLERSRVQLVPSTCGRSEDTFDDQISATPYEGAFIANISGPVRAIRSHIGANSGQYTVDTDVFYPQREDSTVDLRVHVIPGAMIFDDLLTGTTGMTYSDSNTASGVPIDGVPDGVPPSPAASWQMVSAASGSLVTTHTSTTDATGLVSSTYYLDQKVASPVPCTGDAAAWGQNGLAVTGPGSGNLPCTDPTIYGTPGACPTVTGRTTANTYSATRYRYFEAPGLTAAAAANLAAETQTPLQTAVASAVG